MGRRPSSELNSYVRLLRQTAVEASGLLYSSPRSQVRSEMIQRGRRLLSR